jgi:uncharacterized membrane protein YfcA
LDWNLINVCLALGSVCLGSLLQAATGLGAGLILVPMLALISYSLVPGPMIFGSLALSLMMTLQGWKDIDFRGMGLLITGLMVGSALAALLVSRVSFTTLGMVFGSLILLAVGISLLVKEIRISGRPLLLIGALAGVMGTSAGVGAPVLALLYQHRDAQVIRGTLAFLYSVSSVIMLVLLHFVGRFTAPDFISGLILMPGFILGYLVSPRLARFVDAGYARPAVLLLAVLSAGVLIARSLGV